MERATANDGILHYLDYFLFIGKADSSDCLLALNKCREFADWFGTPLAEEKNVLPCSCLEFLRIMTDTIKMEFRLPEAKINRIKSLFNKMLSAVKKTTLRELQSLLGLLVLLQR